MQWLNSVLDNPLIKDHDRKLKWMNVMCFPNSKLVFVEAVHYFFFSYSRKSEFNKDSIAVGCSTNLSHSNQVHAIFFPFTFTVQPLPFLFRYRPSLHKQHFGSSFIVILFKQTPLSSLLVVATHHVTVSEIHNVCVHNYQALAHYPPKSGGCWNKTPVIDLPL